MNFCKTFMTSPTVNANIIVPSRMPTSLPKAIKDRMMPKATSVASIIIFQYGNLIFVTEAKASAIPSTGSGKSFTSTYKVMPIAINTTDIAIMPSCPKYVGKQKLPNKDLHKSQK